MFRALRSDTHEKVYTYEFLESHDDEFLRSLSSQRFLICEECGEPVIYRSGEININHFSHYPSNQDSPECLLRLYKLKRLFTAQLPPEYRGPSSQKNIPPVFRKRYYPLFSSQDEKFYEFEYANIEALRAKDRERGRKFEEQRKKQLERPGILTHEDLGVSFKVRDHYGIPIYCICEKCGEFKENWFVVNYDTLQGKCKDCFFVQEPESNPAFVSTEAGLVCKQCGVIDDPDKNGNCKHCVSLNK